LLPLSVPFALWVAHRLESMPAARPVGKHTIQLLAGVWLATLLTLKALGAQWPAH
jgi:hypothetical protein